MDDPDKGASFGLDNTYTRDGVTVNRYGNPKITWEKSYKTNVGFDMSLYNKINIVADVWKETRNDILMSRSFIPSAMGRSEEHTSELQSLMRISYAVFCLKKKTNKKD